MEEQKKNAGGERKNNSHGNRRHGYFIEPPRPKTASDSAPTAQRPQPMSEASTASKESKEARESRGGEERSKNRRNKNRRNHSQHKSHKPAEAVSEAASLQNAPEHTEHKKAEHTEQKRPADNPHKKNKNHKNHKNNSRHQRNDRAESADGAQKNESARQEKRKSTPDTLIIPRSAPTVHSDEYEEYKLVFDDDAKPTGADEGAEASEVPKTEVVGIRFKSTGKVYYFDPAKKTYAKGTSVIVDTARGQEFGEVAMANGYVNTSDIVPPLRAVVRSATQADVEHNAENKKKEAEAFKICSEKIIAHKLEMKLIDAQYTFDNSKLLFYFTSADRVDFRNLVKDLASVFRTRIELRQIGIRDEAKLVGGLGMCGRPLCCTIFLSDFDQVSIKMAKEQNLSLNSAKISGICGRLMCCLRYEHEAYEYEIKRTPPVDSLVRTESGDGVVTEINPLRRTIKVRLLASPEVPPKTYNRDEVTMLRKKQKDNK